MITEDRYKYILKKIEENGSVTVTELTDELMTSESTIRRDLIALDKTGSLKKVHGGATGQFPRAWFWNTMCQKRKRCFQKRRRKLQNMRQARLKAATLYI